MSIIHQNKFQFTTPEKKLLKAAKVANSLKTLDIDSQLFCGVRDMQRSELLKCARPIPGQPGMVKIVRSLKLQRLIELEKKLRKLLNLAE